RWIGRVNRTHGHFSERRSSLIFRVFVERDASARRHIGPAILSRHRSQIVLVGRPVDELLGSRSILRAGRDRQRPGPEPVAALAQTVVWRQRKADLVSYGGIVRVGDERGGDGGVDPHAAFALLEQS